MTFLHIKTFTYNYYQLQSPSKCHPPSSMAQLNGVLLILYWIFAKLSVKYG